jgi:hypothetical protein
MELFLNILWVLIALTALAVWRYHWKRQERGSVRKPWQQWTAFACVLIFVFFAVSLSDDLHAAAVLADDCTVGRHHSLTWNCGCSSHDDGNVIHISLPAGAFAGLSNPLELEASVEPATDVFVPTKSRADSALRGPPSSFL